MLSTNNVRIVQVQHNCCRVYTNILKTVPTLHILAEKPKMDG